MKCWTCDLADIGLSRDTFEKTVLFSFCAFFKSIRRLDIVQLGEWTRVVNKDNGPRRLDKFLPASSALAKILSRQRKYHNKVLRVSSRSLSIPTMLYAGKKKNVLYLMCAKN